MRASGAERSDLSSPLPLRERVARMRRIATGEGSSLRIETPHPARTCPRHLLPQGEKGGRTRYDKGSCPASSTPRSRSTPCWTSCPARSRTTMPRCWWRRPAPARPRGCRWRCSMRRGCGARRSSCWSRAGSRPAPAPSGWRRRWANAPARPSATASASAPKSRAPPKSRSSPRAFFRGRFSTIPNCPASPRCCSTNSTSVRSMPIWGWRWRATRRSACARICAFS